MTTIGASAQIAYSEGQNPLDWAIHVADSHIAAALTVVMARAQDPQAFPIYGSAPDSQTVARRVVGGLLDAGWSPPSFWDIKNFSLRPGELEEGDPQ